MLTLEPGMFVHDLDANWLSHDFLRTQFPVNETQIIQKIAGSGIKYLYIDTNKGDDVDDALTVNEVNTQIDREVEKVASEEILLPKQRSTEEELEKARNVVTEANSIMKNLMHDFRLGKQVEVESIQPIANEMVNSIFRNKDAMVSLTRMKNKDDYTFMHSVSVAGLLISFARAEGVSFPKIEELAIGGLLHDIGKMTTPNEILNKKGKLEEEEFTIMKDHVVQSRIILKDLPGINKTALDVASQHHERIDGSGYPFNLKGKQISLAGQMAAIVDVYDALTSERVYKSAWEPAYVLRKLIEWSQHHFDTRLVHHFIRCLGIYPVGTLIEMHSGRVGIVIEQHEEDLLHPVVKFVYDTQSRGYMPVKIVDLHEKNDDQIKRSVSAKSYGIDISKFF